MSTIREACLTCRWCVFCGREDSRYAGHGVSAKRGGAGDAAGARGALAAAQGAAPALGAAAGGVTPAPHQQRRVLRDRVGAPRPLHGSRPPQAGPPLPQASQDHWYTIVRGVPSTNPCHCDLSRIGLYKPFVRTHSPRRPSLAERICHVAAAAADHL